MESTIVTEIKVGGVLKIKIKEAKLLHDDRIFKYGSTQLIMIFVEKWTHLLPLNMKEPISRQRLLKMVEETLIGMK